MLSALFSMGMGLLCRTLLFAIVGTTLLFTVECVEKRLSR